MNVRTMTVTTLLCALVVLAPARALGLGDVTAPKLELGDTAPPLKVEKWLKGDPVELKEGKVYVVEFWATWCGPCRVSIPQMTELQKKYKEKNVVAIGVCVDGEKTIKNVEPFVKSMGDRMNYAVALDKDNATFRAYMDAFKLNGIPTAFIVDAKGKLVWFGHPMFGLDEVLGAVVGGNSNSKELAEISKKIEEAFEKVLTSVDEYFELARKGEDAAKAAELGKKILSQTAKYADVLNSFAWEILTNDELKIRDKELALSVAKAADEAAKGQDPAIADTLARALFDNGKMKEAIEEQKRAIKLAGENKEMVKELTETLQKYEHPESAKAEKADKSDKPGDKDKTPPQQGEKDKQGKP